MPRWIRITGLELLLITAAMLAMAAIVLPVSRCELQDAYESIAGEELQRWTDALALYLVDHPDEKLPRFLAGPGQRPAGLESEGDARPLSDLLARPRIGDPAQRPYLRHLGPDPWGQAYVVLTAPGVPRQACWMLSAGRDGRIDTAARDLTVGGDDLGIPLH